MNRIVAATTSILLVQYCLQAAPSPHPFTGKYYEAFGQTKTWDQARVDARAEVFLGDSAHLITISDRTEHLVSRDLGGLAERWIGLTDSTDISLIDGFDFSSLGTREFGDTSDLPLPAVGTIPSEGQRGAGFQWITGEVFDYHLWRPGAPADFLGQSDGVHTVVQGLWQDTPAGATLGQPFGPALKGSTVEFETFLESERLHLVERKLDLDPLTIAIPQLEIAMDVMNLPSGHPDIAQEDSGEILTVSLYDPEFGGGFADYVRGPFVSDVPDANDEDFAFRINGQIEIPKPGDWTFAMVTANRTNLTIDDNVFESIGTQPNGPAVLTHSSVNLTELSATPGGSGDVFHFPSAGTFELELTSLDSGFWSYVQLFAAQGVHTEFDAELFQLVGDINNQGLRVVETGDFEDDGKLTDADISMLAAAISEGATSDEFDLNGDGSVNAADHRFWVKDLKHTWVGDSDLDGRFDTSDMISSFQSGKYESDKDAMWSEGDWNGDRRFDTSDLISAFADGGYQNGTIYGAEASVVPEPKTVAPMLLLFGVLCRGRRLVSNHRGR